MKTPEWWDALQGPDGSPPPNLSRILIGQQITVMTAADRIGQADLALEAQKWLTADMRAESKGPWSPETLEEDARRLAEFERTRLGVPWDEVKAWMQSWGAPSELPAPKPRKL